MSIVIFMSVAYTSVKHFQIYIKFYEEIKNYIITVNKAFVI